MGAPAVGVRLVRPEDAPDLAALLVANRAALAGWEPVREEAFFTVDGQRRTLDDALRQHAAGTAWPGLVVVDGVPAGRVNLTNVVHGAFRSGDLGYWVDAAHQGRGVATAAVRAVLRVAFGELGLHRVQAGTLVHNHASRRVLAHNGFVEIGLAPRYLSIAGRWQDHVLHQRLVDDPDPEGDLPAGA